MKTLRNCLIIFVSLVTFSACSKKTDDINPVNLPAPSAELAGAYNVTHYRINNESQQNLPASRKIVIKFGYVTDTEAILLVNDNTSSDPTIDDDYGHVTLNRVGQSIEIRSGSNKIGSYSNGIVEVQFDQSNGVAHFFGKRK